jgi:tetratricopeptide (TPR) repeat protein
MLRSSLTKRSASLDGTNEDQLGRLHIGRALVWTYVAAGQLDRAAAAIPELEAAIADSGAGHTELRGEELRVELLAERGRWAEALRRIERAVVKARAGGTRMRLVRSLGLLHLRIALGAGKPRAIERASAALLGERADDGAAKTARVLMAHRRRDARAVLAGAEEVRGDDLAHAEAKLLAAELLAAGGDRVEAVRLWREVAGTFGRSPQLLILRSRAERALASEK